ncbi:hypothetical protein ACWDSD_38450 [Streptomyces spiralis]
MREGLRLRIRWVQEMQVRMLVELARRSWAGGEGVTVSRLALLRWEEWARAARGGGLPADFAGRVLRSGADGLPAAFRLADGIPMAERTSKVSAPHQGEGAGGGFGVGTACPLPDPREWQRALIYAILFLVIEVLLATVLLLARVSRLENRLERSEARMDDVRHRLEQTRSPARNRFGWLASSDPQAMGGTQRTFVFVPVLMVAGAVLSGLVTVIQKIVGATAGRAAERRLAGRLTALTAAPLGQSDSLEDHPAIPPARPGRTVLAAAATVGGLLLVPLLWSALADAMQTRPEPLPDAASTTMVFKAQTRGDQRASDLGLAADDLWQTCRRSSRPSTRTRTSGGYATASTLPSSVPRCPRTT